MFGRELRKAESFPLVDASGNMSSPDRTPIQTQSFADKKNLALNLV